MIRRHRRKYTEAEIEMIKAVCDLLSDGIKLVAETQCGLPIGTLGRSETLKKAQEKKKEAEKNE